MRHESIYQAIKEEHQKHLYPVSALCSLGGVSRAAYYKWLYREIPENECRNIKSRKRLRGFMLLPPTRGIAGRQGRTGTLSRNGCK